jgi:ABC-type transport system involved in multi-copper enzyme maturation permease subunit
MTRIVARKELAEAVRTPQFFVNVFVCLLLLPAATSINVRDYQQRAAAFERNQTLAADTLNRRPVAASTPLDGYRPPSPFSPFFSGLELLLPTRITVTPGSYSVSNNQWISNPAAVLFGRVDLFFIVSVVLSLLAFVFASSAIANEQQTGELRFTLAAPVSARQLFAGKFLGNYVALVFPFIVGTLLTVPFLWIPFGAESPAVLIYLALFVLVALLFLFSLMALAFLVLSLVRRPMFALQALLFTWLLLVYVVPKTAPIVAELIQPSQSHELLSLQSERLQRESETEFKKQSRILLDSVLAANNMGNCLLTLLASPDAGPRERHVLDDYWALAKPLKQHFEATLQSHIAALESTYTHAANRQQTLTVALSRLSPVGCLTNIAAAISHNGSQEVETIEQSARAFQSDAERMLYSRYTRQLFGDLAEIVVANTNAAGGHGPVQFPALAYHRPPITAGFFTQWPDLLVLLLLSALCFGVSLSRFEKRLSWQEGSTQ